MALIKCKAKHSLKWIENSVLATAAIELILMLVQMIVMVQLLE